MRNRGKIMSLAIIFSVLNLSLIISFNSSSYSIISIMDTKNNEPKASNGGDSDVIVFFNTSSYNGYAISNFTFHGGTIKIEWKNIFQNFSGFAGSFPSNNKSLYLGNVTEASMETDEIIETQMNFATVQADALNSTWSLNGYQGDTNASIAVLDSGINSNHQFFSSGYDPINLSGDIIGWENFINIDSISDDNGHGTFISSVIAGTGTELNSSNSPTKVNLYGNYSHFDFSGEVVANKNYTFKVCSFNASKPNSNIIINSTYEEIDDGIEGFSFELYNGTDLVNSSYNANEKVYYIINQSNAISGIGIYDLYVNYRKEGMKVPTFSFNASVSFFPETYILNRSSFTGIANATKIVSYKIVNQSGIGFSSDLISALASVIQNKSKYHIVSVCLSIGTIGEEIEAVNTAITEVINNGTLVVIASGNNGVTDPMNSLASNKNAIVVGAINDEDKITSYSSMGGDVGDAVLKPDIVAPGGSKLDGHRTIIGADSKSNKTTVAYGTSIATAIVSAAINLLIEAKWGSWNEYQKVNLTEWVKIIKARLLMTASETNLDREDDPATEAIDETDYSPTNYFPIITNSLNNIKDEHEGYGRLNIQGAIDAISKSMDVGKEVNGTLISSEENPLGKHVFARKVNFLANTQYLINLTYVNGGADFDIFIYSNESNRYGEPILLDTSRKFYGDLDAFYFTPNDQQKESILVVKAIDGNDTFKLNITQVVNDFEPEMKVPELGIPITLGTPKNTTVLSVQDMQGNSPNKNYTIDRYRFFIDYYDNDTTNAPPQEIYVSVDGKDNYTLARYNPLDNNFTDGTLYWSEQVQFHEAKTYEYFFMASDGLHPIRFPTSSNFTIKIEIPAQSIAIPYVHDFNSGSIPGNWVNDGTGWDILNQINYNDDRSRVPGHGPALINIWNTLYFGRYHFLWPINYTYQPMFFGEEYPNGSITTPLFNLTQLSAEWQPIAKFGLRISINDFDNVFLQININWTGWTTLRTYSNEEREWFLEEINLTQYKGSYVQFRLDTDINDLPDPIKNKGVMLDYFAIENYTNNAAPQIFTNPTTVLTPQSASKFERYTFECEYYDTDNNYPEYVYLEIEGAEGELVNYSMHNLQGDWDANSSSPDPTGILFSKELVLGDLSNRSFRFHASDGKNIYTIPTNDWYNRDDSLVDFINPTPLEFNVYQSEKAIGYDFANDDMSDYYVGGFPVPDERTAWLAGDNTWHPLAIPGTGEFLYGGIGQMSYGAGNLGYDTGWDAKLMTRPLRLREEYDVFLEFDYNISMQQENPIFFTNPDRCIVLISTDYGNSWTELESYTYSPGDFFISGIERIDLSAYSDDVVMIMFTLHSNEFPTGFAFGCLINNIYIGYDKNTDFVPPVVEIKSPDSKETIFSTITIEATLFDDIKLDPERIQIYIEDESIDREDIEFDEDSGDLTFEWDTSLYEDGIYEVTIVGFDEEGNRAEDSIIVIIDNGFVDWVKWGPWVIFILVMVIIGIVAFIVAEKKGKLWVDKVRNYRVEKLRLKEIDKQQAVKRIETIDPEEELKRPLTLHCKFCKSWFTGDIYDMICPICDHDQIHAAYNCLNCGKWHLKDTPSQDYYCNKCSPVDKVKTGKKLPGKRKMKLINKKEGVRLVRREKDDVEQILYEEGRLLREFKRKKGKRMSILD